MSVQIWINIFDNQLIRSLSPRALISLIMFGNLLVRRNLLASLASFPALQGFFQLGRKLKHLSCKIIREQLMNELPKTYNYKY